MSSTFAGHGGTDWSRLARLQRKLESVDCDSLQTRITDYFEIIDKIGQLTKENKKLSDILRKSLTHATSSSYADTYKDLPLTAVVKQAFKVLEHNCGKIPTQRRHFVVLKNFATSLYNSFLVL